MKQFTKIALFCLYDKTDDDLHFAQGLAELGFYFVASPETADWLESHNIPMLSAEEYPHPICSACEKLHFEPVILESLLKPNTSLTRSELALNDLPFVSLVYMNLLPLEIEMRKEGVGEESIRRKMETDAILAMRNALEGGRIIIPERDTAFFKDILVFIAQQDTISKEKEVSFREMMRKKVTTVIHDYCELCTNYHKSNQIAEAIANY